MERKPNMGTFGPYHVRFELKITEGMQKEIKRLARIDERSEAEVVRQAIRQYLIQNANRRKKRR